MKPTLCALIASLILGANPVMAEDKLGQDHEKDLNSKKIVWCDELRKKINKLEDLDVKCLEKDYNLAGSGKQPDLHFLEGDFLGLEDNLRKKPRSEINLPASVSNYLKHVKKENFEWKDVALGNMLSGRYLELEKAGDCSEFAANALMHLQKAEDIQSLHYVQFSFAEPVSFCLSDNCNPSKIYAHAIVAYQDSERRWHGLSNGHSLGTSTVSFDELIDFARIEVETGWTEIISVSTISLENIPQSVLTGETDKDYTEEMNSKLKEYNHTKDYILQR